MIPHFRPSHLARGVSDRERKRGRIKGRRKSLSMHMPHDLLEAEGSMVTHLRGLKEDEALFQLYALHPCLKVFHAKIIPS
jgi:hypothetical protein